MDRLFRDFGFGGDFGAFDREPGRFGGGLSAWSPQVEVFERGNQLVVRADLPGMTRDDIQVDITDDALVIRGERRSEREEDEEGYHRSERSYGSFYRTIPLGEGVDAGNAEATFRNGVLEITMPAPKRAERRRLEIRKKAESEEQQKPRTKAMTRNCARAVLRAAFINPYQKIYQSHKPDSLSVSWHCGCPCKRTLLLQFPTGPKTFGTRVRKADRRG